MTEREICARVNSAAASRLPEPAAPIRKPPTERQERDGGGQGPPNREHKIGEQAERTERDPEDLALHHRSLTRFFPDRSWRGVEFVRQLR